MVSQGQPCRAAGSVRGRHGERPERGCVPQVWQQRKEWLGQRPQTASPRAAGAVPRHGFCLVEHGNGQLNGSLR